jgi:hypothetical protein
MTLIHIHRFAADERSKRMACDETIDGVTAGDVTATGGNCSGTYVNCAYLNQDIMLLVL